MKMRKDFFKQEKQSLEKITDWYFEQHQQSFNNQLTHYWYQTIKPFFVGQTALELGPAEGIMTKPLAQDFKTLYVLDAVEDFVDHAQKLAPNIKGFVSFFEEFKPKIRFDTIIMSHVLEHVVDPIKIMKLSKDWLAPRGRIIVVVPNGLSFHRLLGVGMGLLETPTQLNQADIGIGHRRVYTRLTLDQASESAGLKTIAKGGIFLKFLSNRQLENLNDQKLYNALFQLGQNFPLNACELYSVLTL